MPTTIVLFTRDLRVHDHPALHAAATAGDVVPLFVFDEHPLQTFGGINRLHFLLESLEDLRTRLRELAAICGCGEETRSTRRSSSHGR